MMTFREIDLAYERWAAKRHLNLKRRIKVYSRLVRLMKAKAPMKDTLNQLWSEASKGGTRPRAHMAVIYNDWRTRLKDGKDEGALAAAMGNWIPSFEASVIRSGQGKYQVETIENLIRLLSGLMKMRSAIGRAILVPKLLFGLCILISLVFIYFGVPFILSIFPIEKITGVPYGVAVFYQFLRQFVLIPVALLVAAWLWVRWSMNNLTGKLRLKLERLPPWSGHKFEQGMAFLISLAAILPNKPDTEAIKAMQAHEASPYMKERLAYYKNNMKSGELGNCLAASGFEFPSAELITDLIHFSLGLGQGEAVAKLVLEEIESAQERAEQQAVIYNVVALIFAAAFMVIMFGSFVTILVGAIFSMFSGSNIP